MMRWIGLAVACSFLVSCGHDDDHADECPSVENPSIDSFIVDPDTVAAGGNIDVTIAGSDLGFAEHDEGDDHHGEAEACPGGHIHVYLDDLMTNPLAQEEALEFTLTIPDDTEPGEHTLIARLHNRDHIIYKPEVTKETDITVEP